MAAYASNPIVLSSGLPTYTNACTSGDYIEDFIFGAFSNLGTGCGSPGPGNWSNYLGTGPTVQQGQTYSVMAKAGPGFGQWFGLYADFNQDGDFLDPGEFFDLGQATAGGTATLNVMIPISALAGTSKLRVRSSFNGALLAEDGCNTNLEYGEIEDYDLYINAPCDIPDLTIGSQTPCNPNTNTYTQEVTVTYSMAPSMGFLVVHNQNFSITSSPQTVVLNNLTADANPVNVEAHFSSAPGCSRTENALFTAPANCTPSRSTGAASHSALRSACRRP
jgi:hypothetical protein